MKRIFIPLMMLATVLVLLSSCVDNANYAKTDNKQQSDFDNFLATYRSKEFDQKNDIQKKEFYRTFEHDLFNYVDSMKLVVNWKGVVNKIETKETGEHSTLISMTITYKPEKYREIEFNCMHVVNTDSLKYDDIYNSAKEIADYSTVYFDGIIRTKNDSTVCYSFLRTVGDELNIAYPKYDFIIVGLNMESKGDTLPTNLKKAVDYSFILQEPLKANYLGKISDKEKDKRFNSMLPEYQNLKSKLSDEELRYISRVNEAITLNYLYGNK